ncbi:hypothetical protein EON62_02095, partial [archaeon]
MVSPFPPNPCTLICPTRPAPSRALLVTTSSAYMSTSPLPERSGWDDAYARAWMSVAGCTPPVLRNTAYADTSRRVLGGERGVIAQFCEGHLSTKRMTDLVAPGGKVAAAPPPPAVRKPFDASTFHFLKCRPAEQVLRVTLPTHAEDEHGAGGEAGEPSADHRVWVNANPLWEGHGLFTPHVDRCQPQVMTPYYLLQVMRFTALSPSRDMFAGFNSLGAWASVNHFHAHVGFLCDIFPSGLVPIAASPRKRVLQRDAEDGSFTLSLAIAKSWPSEPFVFSVEPKDTHQPSTDAMLRALARVAGRFVAHLVDTDTAHTVMVMEGGTTVFVLARAKQTWPGPAGGHMATALIEFTGVALVYSLAHFESVTAEEHAEVLSSAQLAPEHLASLTTLASSLMSSSPEHDACSLA